MGYWLEKRQIQEITNVSTLRAQDGRLLCRVNQVIRDSKSYRIELKDLLHAAGLDSDSAFIGSIEVEFFSGVNLMFPYPAAVVNYYGPYCSAVVHTAQRVYNDYEDMIENSETSVPESGFNIYADDNHEPFVSLVNGCEKLDKSFFEFRFFNAAGEMMSATLDAGPLGAYETKYIYLSRIADLETFLGGKPGACKMRFKVKWVYPRLIAGNFQKNPAAMNITHTYYDCSEAAKDSDYWHAQQPQWHPASLIVPVTIEGENYTNIYFYPILSPSSLAIDLEFYDGEGKLLGGKESALHLNAPLEEYKTVQIKEACAQIGIDSARVMSARIIARPIESSRLPARIKIGLDLGQKEGVLPCNICTNLAPFNPKNDVKPSCFRWGPCLADQENPILWFLNSSPAVQYNRSADLHIIFHRESDNKKVERRLELRPHGSYMLSLRNDPELWEFLEGKPGWFTLSSPNPNVSTYYFANHPSGFVGGDHGF